MTDQIHSEDAAGYEVATDGDEIIRQALDILAARIRKPDSYVTCPEDAEAFAVLKLAERQSEVFAMLWLDNRHGIIAFSEMFYGTIDGASVYPREVVREALQHNAAACVLVHNHPSGNPEPSQADQRITGRLKDALQLINVRVLDHLIVGGADVLSFAKRGLI